ncbi:uncharacterized protein LOC134780859 [Penaeus indicus]|uniref:uncharacterized protein LOC134780859 n=1 Tax=Penaeus indicus TaxID=29960 RepID=UPI00300C2196
MARPEAHRQFYDFTNSTNNTATVEGTSNPEKFIEYVAENVIGNNTAFTAPFGPRKVIYCDYIASGRSLKFIEDYISNEVLPQYGSTHTTSTVTALQTTLFRHEARDIIRNTTQASEHDRVLFVGSGATGAMQKLIHSLKLTEPPVVFVDPYAHHSTLLPWREIGAKVVRIRETAVGDVDLTHLEEVLKQHQSAQCRLVGCFTAASNITGAVVDDVEITMLLHKYGALAFWDYATAAPYVDVKMNPVVRGDTQGLAHKDALYFSMHKFLGGVQTPGILIAKKSIFQNSVPEVCGGGSVFFVSRDSHRYLQDVETREEGGTPAIVEAIRAGLVMQLKKTITAEFICNRNRELAKKLSTFVQDVPELIPLGYTDATGKLPVLSFVVRHPKSGLLLHHNFVCAVLNDLFGVQARGGCACAGPYAQDLLGIDEGLAQQYERLLVEDSRLDRSHLRRHQEHSDVEVLRPGFVRLNLPYTASDEQINFILSSVKEVCVNGWQLLPQYNFNPETGEWKHHTNLVFRERQWLQNVSYSQGIFSYKKKEVGDAPDYVECLKLSKDVFEQAVKASQRRQIPDDTILFREEAAQLRWFLLPSEAKQCMEDSSGSYVNPQKLPFTPPMYPLDDEVLAKRPDFTWQTADNVSQRVTNISVRTKVDHAEIPQKVVGEGADMLIDKEGKDQTGENSITGDSPPDKNSSRKKAGKVVCEDLKCFVKRDDTNACEEVKEKTKWHSPPKNIFNPTVEVLQQFNMIQDGDRVLVCLSGGKDSLSLLHVLKQYQYYAGARGIKFNLGAVTVDPMSASYDPRPLIPYLASLGVPYFFEQQDILQQAAQLESLNSICSFCSRMKRGRIYAAARREGYNVLAFGQHLDDLAESFIMSIFHNGRLRTMKAHYTVKEGDLRVIRPFVHVREKDLRRFAETKKLPIIPENCPACFEAPKERHRVKQMLAQQEVLFPGLYWSLRTALQPVMAISLTGMENQLFGKNGKLAKLTLENGNDDDDDDGNF